MGVKFKVTGAKKARLCILFTGGPGKWESGFMLFKKQTNKHYQQLKLPSSLRPPTRECVHLVTRGHFRSRDKDGDHIIRSTVAKRHASRLYVL